MFPTVMTNHLVGYTDRQDETTNESTPQMAGTFPVREPGLSKQSIALPQPCAIDLPVSRFTQSYICQS